MSLKIREPNKYGKLNVHDLDDFESLNQIKIPTDYKNFLLRTNGGAPIYDSENESIPGVRWFYGFHEGENASIHDALSIYEGRLPSWYFPIANDYAGNLYIMSLFEGNYGLIAFWDHEGELLEGNAEQHFDNLTLVAESFSEFEKMFE